MDTTRFVRSPAHALLVAPATALTLAENAQALSLMTDFAVSPPATVSANRHIDAALNDMIVTGVRALIVTTRDEVTPRRPYRWPRCSAQPGSSCSHAALPAAATARKAPLIAPAEAPMMRSDSSPASRISASIPTCRGAETPAAASTNAVRD
jgi:hypothetical protein